MKPEKWLAVINTVAFIITIATNAIANILPLNGLNTGEVSDHYPSLFTPASITFSIWSIIYLLLAGFVFYQWKLLQKKYFKPLSRLFILSCLLNAAWILSWHFLFILLSVIVMLILLWVLIWAFLVVTPPTSKAEGVVVQLTFTVYLAWICVAAIANISAYLVSLPWRGGPLSEANWTIIMMCVASTLALIIVRKFHALAFAVVISWALAGIALKGLTIITPAAIFLMGVLLVAIFYDLATRKKLVN
jgi:benzodiazapine receptor